MNTPDVSWKRPDDGVRQFGYFVKWADDDAIVRHNASKIAIPKRYVTFERG